MTGFDSKQRMAADKLQEPAAFDAFLESQDFYELMQTYRHCLTDAFAPFEAVKSALRAAHIKAIFAQPAQELWLGLTDEEIHGTAGYNETREMYQFALALMAKLKEKNL